MTNGKIMDTIVNALSIPLNYMGPVLGAALWWLLIHWLFPDSIWFRTGSGSDAIVGSVR